MPKRTISNPLALAVLALLDERPMHPYEMVATMRERGKHESIKLNYGSLYSVVEVLQRSGLIVPRETVRAGRRPERTIYAITEAGRAKLLGWLRDLLRRPAKEYPRFMAGLSLLPVLPPEEVTALLEERAARLEEEIAASRERLQAAASDVPALFLIEHDYELTLKQAELDWVRRLIQSIKADALEGMDLWRRYQASMDAVEVERREPEKTSEES